MRTFKILLLLIMLAFIAMVAGSGWFMVRPLPMHSQQVEFTVPPGASLKTAAQIIEAAGVELPAWQLTWLGRGMGRAAKIKAGSYEIERGITAVELVETLTRGDVTQTEVLLVEGKTFREWRAALNAHPDLRHDTAALSEADILKRIGAKETQAEGLFFPDTYLFAKGTSDLEVLARAYRGMQKRLAAAWPQRDPNLPLSTPYQALILASIVEKETGTPADRPLVASVFVNRLRRGMLLQTDPTVIYGMGARFDGNLRKTDLLTDTPYNTYTRPGLPPTPIAMPGLASLQAALTPPPSNKLYFVARGDGSSEFSATLDEHNRAVNKYQRGGR